MKPPAGEPGDAGVAFIPDAELSQLQPFATNSAAAWPYHSKDVADYVATITQHAPEATRSQLLSIQTRQFVDWKVSSQPANKTIWQALTENFGALLLALFGFIVAVIIVAVIIVAGIFRVSFLT